MEIQYSGPIDYSPADLSLQAHAIRLSKLKKPALEVPSWKMLFLLEHVLKTMSSFIPPEKPGYDHDEVVNGKMDPSKSSGFPWTACGFPTKQHVLSQYGSKLNDFYDDCEDYNVLWSLSNKDELRPNEKVASQSTRVFNIASTEHTYVCYRLYGRLADAFYKWHGSFNAVGTSPFGGEFHDLMSPFDKFGQGIFDTDGVSFDLQNSWQFMMLARDVIGSFLPPELLSKHNWAFYQATFSYCVAMDGSVFQKAKSNPSGWLLTIIVNTIIMFSLLLYAWFELTEWSDKAYREFSVFTRIKIVGDDNVTAVAREYRHIYHPVNVVEVLSPIQAFETDGLFKKLTDVSFCQAVPIKLPDGLYVPLYPSSKCYGSLYWLKKATIDPIQKLGKFVSLLETYWFREDFRRVVLKEIRRHREVYGPIMYRDASWQAYVARSGLNLDHAFRKGNFKDLALLNDEEISLGL